MKDVWSSFIFIDFYTGKVREKIKKDEIEPILLESLSGFVARSGLSNISCCMAAMVEESIAC